MMSSSSSTVQMPSLDQPQRLAPRRFQQAVADEGVDLLVDDDALHPDRGVDLPRALDEVLPRLLARHDLVDRQQVDRVERMRNQEALRMRHVLGHVGRLEARRRRTDQRVGGCGRLDLGQRLELEVEPFRHALLDEVGTRHRLRDRAGEGHLAFLGQALHRHARVGAAGIRHHLVDLALGFGGADRTLPRRGRSGRGARSTRRR
jgi:hypothetical protein